MLGDKLVGLDDLFRVKRSFVITEPGYGKTRLLKEIESESQNRNIKGKFVDLKHVDCNLEEYLRNELSQKNIDLENSDSFIICLDALDEVNSQDFSRVVKWIKDFSRKFNHINLVLSCRLIYIKRYPELFTNSEFTFFDIRSFNEDQIEYYLQSNLNTDSRPYIERILDIFRVENREIPIDIPRYLEMIVDLVNRDGSEGLIRLTRAELFDYCIYKKLEIEEKKFNRQQKELTKRTLEKLALMMEMNQTNTLSKDDLMTFFDDVKSNLNIGFLQQVPVDIFYDRSLLRNNIDSNVQEYLAAKEIKRLGRVDQVVFDLAFDKQLREFYPSWINPLEFLMELDGSIFKPILQFELSRPQNKRTGTCHRLLTRVKVENLSEDDREKVFWHVFSYYQEDLQEIPIIIARKLSLYFDPSWNNRLKQDSGDSLDSGESRLIRRRNLAYLLAFLFENVNLKAEDIRYWKERLIEFAKDDSDSNKMCVLFALEQLKDLKVIQRVYHTFRGNTGWDVGKQLIDICMEIDANDPFSVKCLADGILGNRNYAIEGLNNLTEKEAIILLFDELITNRNFLDPREMLHWGEWCDRFIGNMKSILDADIENKVKEFIQKVIIPRGSRPGINSEFVRALVKALKEKDDGYIFELISEIKEAQEGKLISWAWAYIFVEILEKEQIADFVRELGEYAGGREIALDTLKLSRDSNRDIYEAGRVYFPVEYRDFERRLQENEGRPGESELYYNQFRLSLNSKNWHNNFDLLRFYKKNKSRIASYMTDGDRKRLKDLIESGLKKIDPCTLIPTDQTEIFGNCLILSRELEVDTVEFREKIICYIPFAEWEQLKEIFTLIPGLDDREVGLIVKLFNERYGDESRVGNLIEAAQKYKIESAIPVLKKIVYSEIDLKRRKFGLQVIGTIQPDNDFFNTIFEKFQAAKDETRVLAESANQFLIAEFNDQRSVEWRMDQLFKKAFPVTGQINESFLYSNREKYDELVKKEFAAPLMNLKEMRYLDQFMDLLKKSFDMLKKGDEYGYYTRYLWKIVFAYLENLKEEGSYKPLEKIEGFIEENDNLRGIRGLLEYFHNLKAEYLNYMGRTRSFPDCIKEYNRLKEAQYIDIANSRDLFELLKTIINEDLKRWVEDEGAYRYIKDYKGKQESLIQKTIKTQFENCLLRKGFRENDLKEIYIQRESQLLDDQRPDFLIYYGFIGPIMVELKRVDNRQVYEKDDRLEYAKKFIKYMKGNNTAFGIYLIFRINDKERLEDNLPEVRNSFKDNKEEVSVLGLDCIKMPSEH